MMSTVLPNLDTLTSQARQAAARRDWPLALELWAEFSRQWPMHRAGILGVITALLALDRLGEAEERTLAAIPHFLDDSWFPLTLGRIAQQRRDWPAATTHWASFRERFPEEPEGHAGHGMALRETGQLEEAEVVLGAAEARFPGNLKILTQGALTAAVRCDWLRALDRWMAARAVSPGRPMAELGAANALTALGRYDEADTLLTEALRANPDSRSIGRSHAELAGKRGQAKLAMGRWRALLERHPDVPSIRTAAQHAAMRLRFNDLDQQLDGAETEDEPAPVAVPLSEADAVEALTTLGLANRADLRRFFLDFENLGGNCEFGLVQRHFGAEPLGLLRWTATAPQALLAALKAEFAGIGDSEFTTIGTSRGEYVSSDTRWKMVMHTFVMERQTPVEVLRPQHFRRLAYLRDKLVEDLKAGEKLFVYVSYNEVKPQTRARFAAAMRRFGPSRLLLVRPADAANPPGSVRVDENGLLLGYLARFGNSKWNGAGGGATRWDISFRCWLDVCRQAHQIWKAAG